MMIGGHGPSSWRVQLAERIDGVLGGDSDAEGAEESSDVARRRLVARLGKGVRDDVAHQRVAEERAHQHRDGGLDVGVGIGETEGLQPEHVVGEQHAGAVRALAHGHGGVGPLFELTDGLAEERAVSRAVLENRRAPRRRSRLPGCTGSSGSSGSGDCGDVRVHQRIEERRLRPERPEDRDLVDVGLDGDEAGGGAAEAVLGVDALGGVEDSIADFHGREG